MLKESKRIKQVDESSKPYMKTGKKLAAVASKDEVSEEFKQLAIAREGREDYTTDRALQEAAFKTFHLDYVPYRESISSHDLKNDKEARARRLKLIEDNIQLANERDLLYYETKERRIFPQRVISPSQSMRKSLENLESKNFIRMEHMKDKYIPSTTNQEAMSLE